MMGRAQETRMGLTDGVREQEDQVTGDGELELEEGELAVSQNQKMGQEGRKGKHRGRG